jgi:predicted 3-demethylubiquinone-9 3-methyltransferase (glyoxalase superfamily)
MSASFQLDGQQFYAKRAMEAMLQMDKIDIKRLKEAAAAA